MEGYLTEKDWRQLLSDVAAIRRHLEPAEASVQFTFAGKDGGPLDSQAVAARIKEVLPGKATRHLAGLGEMHELAKARAEIRHLRTLIADLLEWADHQADCLIHDDDICDCGYDALAAEWEQLRG